MNKINKPIVVIITSVFYVIMYLLLKELLDFIPVSKLYLWNNFDPLFKILDFKFTIMDIVYFIFGLIVINHGVVNLIYITEKNHTAQDMKIRKPIKLLTTGFYSKARHPMYGTFIMISLGTFFSIRSLWGALIVLLVIIIQTLNAVIEEKTVLTKTFGKEYEEYKKKVKNRLFIPIFAVYIILAACLTVLGLIVNM
jgi:protein-S-isoprenylcysteine O-methyltransferase Ste14